MVLPDPPEPAAGDADRLGDAEVDARISAVEAATVATVDAEVAARSAASTRDVAFDSARAGTVAAAHARDAASATVAAAAAATAKTAALAAAAVRSEAVARALEVAAAAVEAVETVAAALPLDADPQAAAARAAAVAAAVAAAAGAHANATAAAAATVASAVQAAAETVALAATATASAVEGEVAAAALSDTTVAASAVTTSAAADSVVESTQRVEDLTARLRVVAALRASEHRFSVTFEHAPVGMMLVSLSAEDPGRILRVNPALCDLTGRTESELLELRVDDLMDLRDRPAQVARIAGLLADEVSDCEAVTRWRDADGRDRCVRLGLHAVREADPLPAYAIGRVEDITDRRRAEEALRMREERFRLAFDNARVGMMFVDLEGRVLRANRSMSLFVGHSESGLLARGVESLLGTDERAGFRDGMVALVVGEISMYQAEHSWQHARGHAVWGLLSASVVQNAFGELDYVVCQVEDITARKQAEIQRAHQVLHDDLTGLPNRRLLAEILKQAGVRAQRAHTYVAVLFLDLDDFKEVNDSLGHVAGDRVLIEVAARIRGCLRRSDTAARQGGDEFVVICEGLGDPAEANLVADRIDRALAVPLDVDDTQIQVAASVGIAIAAEAAQHEDLLRMADTAMYRAKANGKGRREVYKPAMRGVVRRQLTVASELSHALARDELRLHYQPMYDLRTGSIAGVEALLRWQHPTRGLLGPTDFLDVVEGRRLMIPIGEWVLATAVDQARRWQGSYGVRAPDMWVNISVRQLGEPRLTDVIERLLTETGLAAAKLGLEVTEHQLIGKGDRGKGHLLALRSLGLRLAIDDFGTGFASLEYLHRFRFDEIKIDQAFVSGLGRDPTDTAVTSAVLALGRSLGIMVVAEGVETAGQLRHLQDLGCRLAQGYLLQRPAAGETIDLLLANDVRLSGSTT